MANITDPAARQWVSFIIGEVAAKVAGGNPLTGGTTAVNGTKYNNLGYVIAAVHVIPGVGEIAITVDGAIIVAGVVYLAGSAVYEWAYNKYDNYMFNKTYPPANDHTTSTDHKVPDEGTPNSSYDKVDGDGNVITRRYYDENGRPLKDVDFTDHGNPKQHPKVPHEHNWDWSKNPPRQPESND